MKKTCFAIFFVLMSLSCSPVLQKEIVESGAFPDSLGEISEHPDFNKGNLFVFGGIIVKTTATKEGSLIEAIFVPVDSRGYLKGLQSSNGRFLAVYRGGTLLDPLIYSEKREITIAGEFIEMRKGIIGEMDYNYPFFEIKDIYLWEEVRKVDRYYYMPPPYPPYYYRYRYPYYDPWWGYY